jgi:hypothetical protein
MFTKEVPAEGVAVSAEKMMRESVNQKHSAGVLRGYKENRM